MLTLLSRWGGGGQVFALTFLLLLALWTSATAQPPAITCPGDTPLTRADIGQVLIEVPIQGADSVFVDGSATWLNDTLTLTVSMPVTDTTRVRAKNANGEDTCDVVVTFPGVTTKSGTIDGETWLAAASPFCIVGDLFVANLNIQPGCSVVVYDDFEVQVVGILAARGTVADSIVFTIGGTNTGWQGILFDNTTLGSHLEYCVVEQSVYSGIRITNSDPLITDCSIRDNVGRYGGGIWVALDAVADLYPEVRNCDIKDNRSTQSGNACNGVGQGNGGGGGVWAITTTGSLILDGCMIAGNRTGAGRGSRSGGGVHVTGTAEIRRCVIRNNSCYSYNCPCGPGAVTARGYGGGLYGNGDLVVENCVIDSNYLQATACFTGSGLARGDGLYFREGSLVLRNSIVAANTWGAYGGGGNAAYRGAAYFSTDAQVDIINSTIINNQNPGVLRNAGTLNIVNSIIFGNAGGATQIGGDSTTIVASFCNVENGYQGTGNIDVGPAIDPLTYRIVSVSPCIDVGDPSQQYYDKCFPPSWNTQRNDMGAHGGPGACGWFEDVWMACPGEVTVNRCDLSADVCVSLPVGNEDTVYTTAGTWVNDVLCFTPAGWGSQFIGIIAENGASSDTCELWIHVNQSAPIETDADRVLFGTTETAPSVPSPKWLHVDAPCDPGSVTWEATAIGGDWLQIDKLSGTNPDSIRVSIVDSTYTAGIYGGLILLSNVDTDDLPTVVNITLFVGAGVDVGTVVADPGTQVAVPVSIRTDNDVSTDSVTGFTLPLRYQTNQQTLVLPDSVRFEDPGNLWFQNVNVTLDTTGGIIIVDRPIDDPPLPDSEYQAFVYFSIDSAAVPEVVPIDTTVFSTSSYQFVLTTGDTVVPAFDPGAIIIDPSMELPTIGAGVPDTVWADSVPGTVCVPLVISDADTVLVMVTGDAANSGAWHSDTLCLETLARGACTLQVTAINWLGDTTAQMQIIIDLSAGIREYGNGLLPGDFELGDNYPNPFNPATVIDFALPTPSHVTLVVYNIMGQRVATLIDEVLAAGYYSVDWDSSSMPGGRVASGVYFYRIETADYTDTRKMILLK